jgi:hypothetical protein
MRHPHTVWASSKNKPSEVEGKGMRLGELEQVTALLRGQTSAAISKDVV